MLKSVNVKSLFQIIQSTITFVCHIFKYADTTLINKQVVYFWLQGIDILDTYPGRRRKMHILHSSLLQITYGKACLPIEHVFLKSK